MIRPLATLLMLFGSSANFGSDTPSFSGSAMRSPNHFNVQAGAPADVQIVCTGSSPQIRFTADQSKPWPGDLGKKKGRAEYQSRQKLTFNHLYSLSYEVNVSVFDSSAVDHLVIGQFHQTSDPGDYEGFPATEIAIEADNLTVYTAGDSNPVTSKPYPQVLRAKVPGFGLGQWHKIKIMEKFSYSGSGFLSVVLDGSTIYSGSNILNSFNDQFGPYWKFGSYFRGRKNFAKATVSYRNMKFSDVAGQPTLCR